MIRFLYVRFARRGARPFLSPWLFVIAAVLGGLLKVSRAGDEASSYEAAATAIVAEETSVR